MPSESPTPRVLFGVALTSGSLLMTELSLTRIFSVTMYYHFAFMAISIALFGLSASGVYVFLFRDRLAARSTERLLTSHALAFAALTLIALAALVRVRVGLQSTPANIASIAMTYLLAALPFFAGGAVVSIAIARLSASVNRVYAADLLGAAAACLLLLPALNRLGAPGAIVAAGLMGAAAALLFAAPEHRGRLAPIVGALAVVVVIAARLPIEPFTVSVTKGHEHHAVLFSKWNSFSRIGVYDRPYGDWSLSTRYTGPLPDTHFMDIDSAAATPILHFRGDLRDVEYLQYELTSLGYHLYGEPGRTPRRHCGRSSSARAEGATFCRRSCSAPRRVDGVEINPIIANDVMRGAFRDYSGGVYDHPASTSTSRMGAASCAARRTSTT